jgi:riboflavin synthase
MFTGIIRQIGTVRTVEQRPQARVLTIHAGPLASAAAAGDSICVDGVCLTTTRVGAGAISFDVSAETLRLTTLGELREGDEVNLEPSLRVGDQMGGHFVSGHVEGTGTIRRKEALAGEVRLTVEVEPGLSDQMVMKGSVAVDGISLTIAALATGRFEVSLIPFTLSATTIGRKGPGDRVNIECDMIGRYVRRLLGRDGALSDGGSLTVKDLEEQGF